MPDADLPGDGRGFFGLSGNRGLEGSGDAAAKAFVEQWIDVVDEQLSSGARALLAKADGTSDELIGAFANVVNIDALLNLDVVNETADAYKALEQDQRSLLQVYDEQSDALLKIIDAYDGSLQSLADLSAALSEQKLLAAELSLQYQALAGGISELLGETIEDLRTSLLSPQDLAAERRADLENLETQLSETIDADEIASLVSEIDALTKQIYQSLSREERTDSTQFYIDFLEGIEALAQRQIDAALDAIRETEREVATAAGFETEGVFDAEPSDPGAAEKSIEDLSSEVAEASTLFKAAELQISAAELDKEASMRWVSVAESFEELIEQLREQFEDATRRIAEGGDSIADAARSLRESEVNA